MTVDKIRQPNAARSVVVISSHVVRGSVGNRAMVFALEALGFPVWAVPTLTLPWHPGQGPGTRIVPPNDAFSALLDDLAATPKISELSAVATGYFANAEQVEATAGFIKTLKVQRPDLIYVCDPVIGDANGLYVAEETAAAIRDLLFAQADFVTPNRFELEWLSGKSLEDNAAIARCMRSTGIARAVVTSAHAMLAGGTGNLYIDENSALLAEHRIVPSPPNGTGDLMTALCLAHTLARKSPQQMLMAATQSVYEMVVRTNRRGADELTLELDRDSLLRPAALVQFRQLHVPQDIGSAG